MSGVDDVMLVFNDFYQRTKDKELASRLVLAWALVGRR
jgi:hypothetical protein